MPTQCTCSSSITRSFLCTSSSPQTPVASLHTTTNPTLQSTWKWFPPMSHEQPTNLATTFLSMSINNGSDENWYMDTSATPHLASDTSILSSFSNKSHIKSDLVGNGSSIPVTHTGHSKLNYVNRPLNSHNILVTPNIIKNLIYVLCFTTDNQVSIEFYPFSFAVKTYILLHLVIRSSLGLTARETYILLHLHSSLLFLFYLVALACGVIVPVILSLMFLII